MKRYRLKRWVEVVLIIITFLSIMIMGSECEDTITFIISHLIATIIFVLTISLLLKYGR